MKTTKKFFLFKKTLLLSFITISLTMAGCSLFPKTESETYQNPDGSITEETVTTKGKTTIKETVTTKPDGTIIEKTKTTDEDGNSEWEQTTTYPDGSVGIETGTEEMNDSGDIKSKSEEIITYSDSNASGKKTEKITKEEDNTDRTKGAVTTTTVETEYKDGHKEKITEHYEPLTGITTKETIITAKDGSSVTTNIVDNNNYETSCTTTTVVEKDSSGNPTKKVVTVKYGTWKSKGSNPEFSEKTYEYPNGTETLVKDYSMDKDDSSNKIETTKEGGKTTVETTSEKNDFYEKKVDDVVQEVECFVNNTVFVIKFPSASLKINYKLVNGYTSFSPYNYNCGNYSFHFDTDEVTEEKAKTKIYVKLPAEEDFTEYPIDTSVIIDESKLHVLL